MRLHGNGAPSDDRIANHSRVTLSGHGIIPSEEDKPGVLAGPDHILADTDDDLLLGDKCLEPLSSLTNSGSELPESQDH